MGTRKIKDAELGGEKVYFASHAKATYMSDGRTVENAINSIGSTGGGITVETDPVFSASAAAKITDENISEWIGKQDNIDDLDTIRSGAALGATALQEHQSLAGYATEDYVRNAINESIIQILNGQA